MTCGHGSAGRAFAGLTDKGYHFVGKKMSASRGTNKHCSCPIPTDQRPEITKLGAILKGNNLLKVRSLHHTESRIKREPRPKSDDVPLPRAGCRSAIVCSLIEWDFCEESLLSVQMSFVSYIFHQSKFDENQIYASITLKYFLILTIIL